MIKSIKAILAQDKEKFKVPRKVQDLIPIKNIWPDGIFKVGNKFSKSFRFSDINYLVASREDCHLRPTPSKYPLEIIKLPSIITLWDLKSHIETEVLI